MIERLHAATLFLYRYGGMYPFKKTNRSNKTSLSVCLVLWTVFQNLISALGALYFMVQSVVVISSLNTFLANLFDITWALVSILIPMYFVWHARGITAVSTKLDEIVAICSIHSSKISKTNKLKIILLIFIKIIALPYITYDLFNIRNSDNNITNIKLSSMIIVRYHATFMEIIITLTFAIYLSILEEYFQLCDACLVELFHQMRSSHSRISEVTTEEPDDTSTSIGLQPIPLHRSRIADSEATRLLTVFKPIQFKQSARPRGNTVVDVTTLKIARKPVKIQRKVQQDALGRVNRIK